MKCKQWKLLLLNSSQMVKVPKPQYVVQIHSVIWPFIDPSVSLYAKWFSVILYFINAIKRETLMCLPLQTVWPQLSSAFAYSFLYNFRKFRDIIIVTGYINYNISYSSLCIIAHTMLIIFFELILKSLTFHNKIPTQKSHAK